MIEIKNLTKLYGGFKAVNDLTFTVKPGEILGFLGVNGAGKTTTLKMLAGILQPNSGKITIGGYDLQKNPIETKGIVGYIPDRPYLYSKLTGREFLYFIGDLYQVSPKEIDFRIDSLLEEYRLAEWQHELIESYSHGMKQRLATCAALIHDPKVIIVDEPMVGLDPHGAKLLKDRFRAYAKKGVSILLSTHSLNVAEEIADRLAIINRGALLTSGTLNDVKKFAGEDKSGLEEIFLKLTDESAVRDLTSFCP